MYKEPRISLRTETNPKYNTGTTPTLIPVIIGDGPTSLKATAKLTRSTEAFDALPSDSVISIISVGVLENATDFKLTTDYTLSENKIVWSVEETATSPTAGQSYYVTYEYTPGDDQYEPKLISTKAEITKYYGANVDDSGEINPIALGCELALEETNIIYGVQVKPSSGSTMSSADLKKALDEQVAFLPNAYRIVPMTLDQTFNLEVISHVGMMSSPEEAMERCTIVGIPETSSSTPEIITAFKTYAEALKNSRASVVYPGKATKVLDDGNTYVLPAQYICAALAGWKAGRKPQTSFTKGQINSFVELKGNKLTRAQKNLLAESGVMILEQPGGAGTPIEVRHGLTTDMSSPQTREISIVEVTDYCAKYLRTGLKMYIGQHNITSDLISRVRATITSMLDKLSKDKTIVSGTIIGIYQDELEPTTLVVSVSIEPPYPCNNIDITLYLE